MATKTYVVVHGSVKLDGSTVCGPGEEIQLEESEAKKMDKDGTCFVEKGKHDAVKRGDAAKQAELDKAGIAHKHVK